MAFIADTSSEEELVGLAGHATIAEDQCPEIINSDRHTPLVGETTKESTSLRIKHIDATITKIAYQQIITELAEIGGSESHAPGRVEHTMRNKALNKGAISVEDIEETMPWSRYVIVLVLVLFGIGNIELATDVFDADRRISLR